MPAAILISPFTLTLQGAQGWNARTPPSGVAGVLIRPGPGFGCLQPWPSLGDAPLAEHLAAWRAGRLTPLVRRALECAAADGAARVEGRSLFTGLSVPLSHATVPGAADFARLEAEGFRAVKLKADRDLGAVSARATAAALAGLRVRLDANGVLSAGEMQVLAGMARASGWHDAVEFFEDPVPYDPALWLRISEETGWLLALDRWPDGREPEGGPLPPGVALRVVKPAVEALRPWQGPVVVTSAMDHPLGQLFAAWEAARYPGEQREAGLLTHRLLVPDAFTERLGARGPALTLPGGTGLGFDDLLEALPWEPLLPRVRVHVNPRSAPPAAPPDLPEDAEGFFTSGSSGVPRLVVLTEAALDASAAAVNDWLGLTGDDVWLRALPDFHVGGRQIHRRAALAGSRVIVEEGRWSAGAFRERCEQEGVTVTSLVPAQVSDLVAENLPAPATLRAVLVGGGALEPALWQSGRALGWPLLPSYGMTETASQVATAHPEEATGLTFPPLRLLPGWVARVAEPDPGGSGRLELRGPGLCAGWHAWRDGAWHWEPLPADGWLRTGDRVRLADDGSGRGTLLTFAGRLDRVVKVLGELVDLDALEQALAAAGLPAGTFAVEPVPHPRRGAGLVLATEQPVPPEWLAAVNAAGPGFARIQRVECLPLPRSALGKIQRGALRERLGDSG